MNTGRRTGSPLSISTEREFGEYMPTASPMIIIRISLPTAPPLSGVGSSFASAAPSARNDAARRSGARRPGLRTPFPSATSGTTRTAGGGTGVGGTNPAFGMPKPRTTCQESWLAGPGLPGILSRLGMAKRPIPPPASRFREGRRTSTFPTTSRRDQLRNIWRGIQRLRRSTSASKT